MDTRQLKYIVQIADCGNITRAAENLFISQSGLNQQLSRIEQELGTTLFDRTTHSLTITDAGQIVLAYARRAIKEEEQMRTQVADLLDGTAGEIRINLAMEPGVEIFCSVFPRFHERYPNILLKIQDHIVREQYDLLMKGELDIGMVMTSKKNIPDLEFVSLAKERFLLGVPDGHRLAEGYHPAPDGDYPLLDLAFCQKEPFSLMFSGSTMREVIDPFFEQAGFQPQILFESRTNHVVALMVSHGLCLTILPESQARNYPQIRWFQIPGEPTWESCFVYHRLNPPRKAGWYLIELAKESAPMLAQRTRPRP